MLHLIIRKSYKVFSEGHVGSLVLRRVIKADCFEGMSQGGGVTPALFEHHMSMAAGGVAIIRCPAG